MFTEKDGRKKLEDAVIFTKIVEISTTELLSHKGIACHPIEEMDIVYTDGIQLWVEGSGKHYVVFNATYVVVARMSPFMYLSKLFVYPGLLDNEAKIDELIEKSQVLRNIPAMIDQLPMMFSVVHDAGGVDITMEIDQ